ncbi:YihY/virulence factor BrkB family protein [Rhodovarius crocodyli]|nr:YihY/virulence factor BrkB family protein [Rhodovarius crocodyli]
MAEDTATAAPEPAPVAVWLQAWNVATSDQISLVAAGCAFYAMLAIFPALSLAISIYGIGFDLNTIEPQLAVLQRLLPESSFQLIAGRVRELVLTPREDLKLSAVIGGAIALWSASAGVRALLGALNMAHGQTEGRGVLAFYLTAFMLTLGAVLAVVVGLGLLVALPTGLHMIGLTIGESLLLRLSSLSLLLVAVLIAISMLYRFGPNRPPRYWRVFSAGAVSATLLWLVASAAFSFYVTYFANYSAMYGALGAVVALMTWMYVSVYVILLGAELNAAIERYRRRARA